MKKYLSLLILQALSFGAVINASNDLGGVPVINDSYGHKITRDGVFSTGEAVTIESAWGRNNVTGEEYLYEACTIGYGNPVSKDLKVVGTDKIFMKAAFLLPDADPEIIEPLAKYSESFAYGINWEGTRLCAIVANPQGNDLDENDPEKMTMMYLPVCCDIDPVSGKVTDPVFLPTPPRDFFGLVPQYCTAFWISDDGKTILGQVIDNSGFFIYPIVYKQDANDNWSYILPSESLFNPDNLEVPKWPVPEMDAPQATDFIGSADNKAYFEQLLEEWDGDEYNSPYELLNPATAGSHALMTQDEWDAYQKALLEFSLYYEKYQTEIDEYYDQYSYFIAHSANFLQSSMSMNNEGTLVSQTRVVTKVLSATEIVHYNVPIIFNLVDGSIQELGNDYSQLEIQQIMSDGTIIAASPKPSSTSPDLTPQHTLVRQAGTTDFIPIDDFIKASNPEAYSWMQEFLFHEVPIGYDEYGDLLYKPMTVTGLVAVSEDWTTMSGGVDTWAWNFEDGEYFTYFLTGLNNPNAGIEGVNIDGSESPSYIHNMQGVKINDRIESLSPGIYIINGKKVIIK